MSDDPTQLPTNGSMTASLRVVAPLATPDAGLARYLGLITVGGLGVLALALGFGPRDLRLLDFCVWLAVFGAGEALAFRSASGQTIINMTPALHVAALACLPRPELFLAAWLSRCAGNLWFHRRPLNRAAFNSGKGVLALLSAGVAYDLLSGGSGLGVGATRVSYDIMSFALLVSGVVHCAVDNLLACRALALTLRQRFVETLNLELRRRDLQAGFSALYLLAPLIGVTTHALGPVGLVAMLIPLGFVRHYWKRAVLLPDIVKPTPDVARLVSRGDAAASVGNALSGHAELLSAGLRQLQEAGEAMSGEERRRRLLELVERVQRMGDLSRGLIDISYSIPRRGSVDLPALASEVLERLRLKGGETKVRLYDLLSREDHAIQLDREQMEQLLTALVQHAGDSARSAGVGDGQITLEIHRPPLGAAVQLSLQFHSTPGQEQISGTVDATLAPRVGRRIPTAQRIAQNCGGSLSLESLGQGRNLLVVSLPVIRKTDRAAA